MPKHTLLGLLLLVMPAVSTTAQEAPSTGGKWKCERIEFQARGKNERSPLVFGLWVAHGEVFLRVNYVDGEEFGRFVDGKLVPFQFPESVEPDSIIEQVLEVGDSTLIFTSHRNSLDVSSSRVVRVKNGEVTELQIVGAPFFGGSATVLASGEGSLILNYPLRRKKTLYVMDGDRLTQATMPDGSIAEMKPFMFRLSGGSRCIKWEWKAGALVQYVLVGTVFHEQPQPDFPEGADVSSYSREFIGDGAVVTCKVGDGWQIWFEQDGKQSALVDAEKSPLVVDSPTLKLLAGRLFVLQSGEQPAAYVVEEPPTAQRIELPKGAVWSAPEITDLDGAPLLWNGEVPYQVKGLTAVPVLKDPDARVKGGLVGAGGNTWFASRWDERSRKNTLLMIQDGEIIQTTSDQTYYIKLDQLHPIFVDGTWVFALQENGQRMFLCRLEGSKIVPFDADESEQMGQSLVSAHDLKFVGAGREVYSLDFTTLRRCRKE